MSPRLLSQIMASELGDDASTHIAGQADSSRMISHIEKFSPRAGHEE